MLYLAAEGEQNQGISYFILFYDKGLTSGSVRYRLNTVIPVFVGTAISKEILAILVNNLMFFFFMLKALKAFKIAVKGCFSYILFGYRIMGFGKPLRSN